MRTPHGRADRPRRAAIVRGSFALSVVGALLVTTAVPADARLTATPSTAHAAQDQVRVSAPSPTPPPNPSDDDITGSQSTADAAATEVGRLSGLAAATQNRIDALSNDMEAKQELVMKAYTDLDVAKADAVDADTAATRARQAASVADGAVGSAQDEAAQFAAASFRNGSIVGSEAALLDSKDLNDLLSGDAILDQVSQNQLDFIGKLQAARNRKANADAAARAAQDKAKAAEQAAQVAARFAAKKKDATAVQLGKGRTEFRGLQTQLTSEQSAYQNALARTDSLKSQRDAYNVWLAEKKAEEERQRQLAEARRKAAAIEAAKEAAAAKAAAIAKAQAEADARARAEAERQAAIEVANAKAARIAAAEAAAADAQRRKDAAAQALASQRAREAAAAAAAQAAAGRKDAAARALSAQRARAAAAQAAAQAAAERRAAVQAAAAQALAARRARESAAAAAAAVAANRKAAAQAAAAQRAADAQRAAEQRAAAAGAESRRQAVLRAQATKASQIQAARKAKEMADRLAQIRGTGTGTGAYFQSCDAARAAGFAPMSKGQPGYRSGLDPNNNGVACDGGSPSDPSSGSSGGSSSGTSGGSSSGMSGGSSSVPSDGSKGSIVVNAALRYLGTPYSWGGGNSSGPTTGITSGCTDSCQQYQPWNTVGFDCSGLVLYAWAQAGVSLPHYSAYQYQSGQHIARADLQPGDLVFFASNTSDWTTIHHVAIYLGNDQLIEAPQSGIPVRIRGWRTAGYIGAVRPGT